MPRERIPERVQARGAKRFDDVSARGVLAVETASLEKAQMKAAEVCFLPGDFLVKHATVFARISGAKSHRAAVQSLGRIAIPGLRWR